MPLFGPARARREDFWDGFRPEKRSRSLRRFIPGPPAAVFEFHAIQQQLQRLRSQLDFHARLAGALRPEKRPLLQTLGQYANARAVKIVDLDSITRAPVWGVTGQSGFEWLFWRPACESVFARIAGSEKARKYPLRPDSPCRAKISWDSRVQ